MFPQISGNLADGVCGDGKNVFGPSASGIRLAAVHSIPRTGVRF